MHCNKNQNNNVRSSDPIAVLCGILLLAATTAPLFGVDVEGLDFEAQASGLAAPVAVTHAGDTRLFITLQAGQVVIFNTNTGRVLPQPFLDIRDRVGSGGERGLLSVAFHPDHSGNGFFFVNYTDLAGDTVVARYSVSADRNVADASSEAILLGIAQPFPNHNGGQLQFGPDGFLYVATGDGGSANDPICSGQDSSTLLGKVLRLDVDQNVNAPPFHAVPASNPFVGMSGFRDEIWALGLRNPWRFSFDRTTGDLLIADVGQNQVEEVDVQASSSGGGENYGWKMMEGTRCTGNTSGCDFAIPGCDAAEYTPPAFDYPHQSGRCSITGGYVYRGRSIPQAVGAYFYGDFCTGEVWAAEPEGATWRSDVIAARAPNLTSFGEDRDGELYLVAADTLYLLTGPSGGDICPFEVGDPRFCGECGPCAEGEGGCRGDDQCEPGLVCAENFGARVGLARTADVCLLPKSLAPPPYTLTELSVPGSFTRLRGAAINNTGQVVGWAENETTGSGFASTAVRVAPSGSSELLDPQGTDRSRGLEINEEGDVYGVILNADGSGQTGVFLFRDSGGFDLLDRGSGNLVRTTFELTAMNGDGDLAGSVARRSDGQLRPHFYSRTDGWRDLTGLDPRFRQLSTRLELINDAGDLVFHSFRSGPNTVVAFETLLLHGDELFELGDFGGWLNVPEAVNRAGRIVGRSWTDDDAPHAYVYSGPGGRLIDVHPRKFAFSNAVAVTAKGIVGGTIASRSATDTIFIWDNRRQIKMRLQARAPDFERLLEDDSFSLQSIDSVRMNERLEFVGRMVVSPANPDIVFQRWFYYSPATGLVDVDGLLAAAGSSDTVLEVTDLNDWGALLLRVDRTGEDRVVVLTPDEEAQNP